jgi:GR25 family glycosyltransferase involved in LPS biosynthesis
MATASGAARWAEVQRRASAPGVGVSLVRHEADGPDTALPRKPHLGPGERGCATSHLRIWRDLADGRIAGAAVLLV